MKQGSWSKLWCASYFSWFKVLSFRKKHFLEQVVGYFCLFSVLSNTGTEKSMHGPPFFNTGTGVTSASWLNKTSCRHSMTTIWHTSTDKNALVGVVGSSTICQGIWEEGHPCVHRVIGMQISVLAVELVVAYEPTLAPLNHSPRTPRKHCHRQSPIDERGLVEVQASRREISAHHWNKKMQV